MYLPDLCTATLHIPLHGEIKPLLNISDRPLVQPNCNAHHCSVCLWVFRFTICHKTEVIKNNLNPVWQPFTIPVRALCNGDYDR